MISERRGYSASPNAIDLQDWRTAARTNNRPLVPVGLSVVVSVVILGLLLFTGALVVQTVSAALFGGESVSGVSAASAQSLTQQSGLVARSHVAVVAFGAELAEFKASRAVGAVGINLDAAEAKRRDDALTILVLECIDAVDRYNLGAQMLSLTQLQTAGLPERFAWGTDCAVGG